MHLYVANSLSIMAGIISPLRNIPYNIYLHITDNCSYMGAHFKVASSGAYIQD
jgi:hypothetical protein